MTITLPIYWTKGKLKPKIHLVGMNFYRNAHHFDQAAIKRDFTNLVSAQLPAQLPSFSKFTVTYSLYYKSPVCDGSNIIALIEKMYLDALSTNAIISDDNVQYHQGSTWSIIGQDKLNPRVEITIQEVL